MPFKTPKKASAVRKPESTKPIVTLEGTDIQVLDGKATVTVCVELKMSKNYQSGGASCGFTFTTPAGDVEKSAKAAFKRVKDIVTQHMSVLSEAVEDLG